MPTSKLTKTLMDRLTYGGENGSKFVIWDEGLPGFGVRVFPSGRKAYVVAYRHAGRQRLLTLGGETLDDARRRARKVLADARDVDPMEKRREARARATTFGQAVDDYLRTRALKPATIADYKKAVRLSFADWVQVPITRITRDMVESRFQRASERGKTSANRDFRFLRALFTYASERFAPADGAALLNGNPCDRLKALKRWHPSKPRDRVVPQERMRELFAAIEILSTDRPAQRVAKVFVAFLLLTGARFREAVTLRWADVDLDVRTVRFAETKSGRTHVMPMGPWLVRALSILERTGDLVFYAMGSNGRRAVQSVRSISGVAFSAHDLRRTFATLASQRCTHAQLKRLLNHSGGGDVTLNHYVRLTVEDLRAPVAAIEETILRAAGVLPPSPIVGLPNASRASSGAR
jgi:integrase